MLLPCKKRVQIYTWLKKIRGNCRRETTAQSVFPLNIIYGNEARKLKYARNYADVCLPSTKTVTHFFRSGFVPDLIGGKTLLLSAHYLDEHVKSN